MPIEIKEVIITTSVEKEPHPAVHAEMQVKQLEELKSELLRSCEHMIMKAIKNQSRR